MAKTAADTEEAVRRAMLIYEAKVLNPKHYDAKRDVFIYRPRISEADVRELANVKSRSTLLSPIHEKLRSDLAEFISDLKVKTGKTIADPERDIGESKPAGLARQEQLAQTIAALCFKIRVLEKELEDARGQREPKVAAFRSKIARKG